MKLKYEELMKANNLKVEDLPKNARIGIKSILAYVGGMKLVETRGLKPSKDSIEKIQANDDWVCMEINNFLAGNKPSTEPLPNAGPTEAELAATKAAEEKAKVDAQAALDAKNAKAAEASNTDPRGADVDKELKVLVNAGKNTLTLQEIKESAPLAYDILFDAYEVGQENGIETTHYKLVETQKEVFSLSKK